MKMPLFGIGLLAAIGISIRVQAQGVSKEILRKHVYTLASDSLQGRKTGTEGSRRAARYIEQQLHDAGLKVFMDTATINIQYSKPKKSVLIKNILYVVPGTDPMFGNEWIVMGAHYDHIGVSKKGEIRNGANDNASSSAALIEVAKRFSAARRSVAFVWFDGEESGLLGSQSFVDRCVIPTEQIKLMIAADMTGHYNRTGAVGLFGIGNLESGYELIADIHADPIRVDTTNRTLAMLMSTDSYPFFKAGLPSMVLMNRSKENYHQPTDDAGTIDYEGLALTADYIEKLLRMVADTRYLVPSETMKNFLTKMVRADESLKTDSVYVNDDGQRIYFFKSK